MFIISLTYKVPVAAVEEHLEAHIAYLEAQYAAGHFLASGRKVPRTGGVILADVVDRPTLDEIIRQDPFYVHNLADVDVTEFIPTKASDKLDFLINRS
jgi:uncharacterized protein YciI